MVRVDTPFKVDRYHPTAPFCFRGKLSAHLMADSDDELVAYAQKLGMKKEWLQHGGTSRAHCRGGQYDFG